MTNNNILEAKSGGTLQLSSVNITNSGSGQINALNTGVVQHNSGTVTGGTINTSGSGVFRAVNSGSNFLSSVSVAGTVDMTTIANSRERIIDGLTFSGGNFAIANGGILSLDSTVTANQTIGGTGTINLNDPGARLAFEGTGTPRWARESLYAVRATSARRSFPVAPTRW